MQVEVINTGTELLLGSVLNTHLAFFGRELFSLGLRITKQVTVPDGDSIREALKESFASGDIVLVTGGLGPTSDDVTLEIAADVAGCTLRLDRTVQKALEERFRSRGLAMTDLVMRQALVPVGATVLPNRNGTAPGLYLPAGGANPHTFLLPGPPRELQPMFHHEVIPRLRKILPPARKEVREQLYRLVGIGESQVEALVGDPLEQIDDLELGYCARPGEVDLRCIGTRAALAEAERVIEPALGEYVATRDSRSLEQVLVEFLIEKKATVVTAESCTGGLIAHRLTNVPGASEVFVQGFVTYANEAKTRTLGVDAGLIERHGAVSREVAAAMAIGARRNSQTDFAISTTGVAGPGGGTEQKPVGTVYLAVASADGCEVIHRRFNTDRETFKWLASQTALDLLRRSWFL